MVCGFFGGVTLAIRRGSETPFLHERIKTPMPVRRRLSPKYSGQGHAKGASTGPRNENMKNGCAFEVFRMKTRSMDVLLEYSVLHLSYADAEFR